LNFSFFGCGALGFIVTPAVTLRRYASFAHGIGANAQPLRYVTRPSILAVTMVSPAMWHSVGEPAR